MLLTISRMLQRSVGL